MMNILSPIVIQSAGVIIVGAVLIQMMLVLASAFRRFAYENEQARVTLINLRHRTNALLVESKSERDRVEFSWNGFRKFEIEQIISETKYIKSYYLTPHDGRDLPPFLPGQHLTFQLKHPDLPKPLVRCYSLSDSPNNSNTYRVSIKVLPPPRSMPEAPPGVSSTLFHEQLNVGDILDVKAPSGNFYLQMAKDNPIVLIGGGVGITPVLSMLNAICETESTREVWFFLGIRDGTEHPMKGHLEAIALQHDNVNLNICYSNPDENDVEGIDYQHSERVSVDLFKRLLPSNNYTFYICGPPPMMELVTTDLKSWGVPNDEIHFEAFGPATVKKTKSAVVAPIEGTPAINVVFSRSGATVPWDNEAESLLDFALRNGIDIDSGCRAGNCGTCITAIKSGEITYNIEPGLQPEDGSCLTCISIPKNDLILDA